MRIALFSALALGACSSAFASLPGSTEITAEIGSIQNFVDSSSWNTEVAASSNSHTLSNPLTDKSQSTLSLGLGLGYMIDQAGPLRYGAELGYRFLGGERYNTQYNGGNNENLKSSVSYERLNFVGEIPMTDGVYLLGRAGLSAATVKSEYTTNISGANGFTTSTRATKPYLAAGIGLGGDMAQFQLLYEHVGLPDMTQQALAGRSLSGASSLNLVTLGATFYF